MKPKQTYLTEFSENFFKKDTWGNQQGIPFWDVRVCVFGLIRDIPHNTASICVDTIFQILILAFSNQRPKYADCIMQF